MLLQVLQTILPRCDAYHPEERCVERLAVGKTNHIADFLHAEILISFVNKDGHRLINAILVDEGGVVHVKTHIDNSRNIAGIRS